MAATLLLVLHFALVNREKLRTHAAGVMTEPESTARPDWPFQLSRHLAAFFVLMIVAAVLAWQWPVWETRGMETADWELPPNALRLTAPADPDLTHLARPEWSVRPLSKLRHMVPPEQEVLITGADCVRSPGERRFYGKQNVMPGFDAERLPDRELRILIPWMRGAWQGVTENRRTRDCSLTV